MDEITLEKIEEKVKSLSEKTASLVEKLETSTKNEDIDKIKEELEAGKKAIEELMADKKRLEEEKEKADLKERVAEMGKTLENFRAAKKIEFPTDNMRAGNLDEKTKLWQQVFMGNITLHNGKLYKRDERGQKALYTTASGYGAEWVITGAIDDFYDQVRLASKVVNLFKDYPVSHNSNEIPIATGDMTWYLTAESDDDDDTGVTASTPGTGKVTLTAKKFMGRTWFSAEEDEDSIVPLIPQLKANMAITAAEALEDALINGDDSATHQDADVTSSSDVRKAWKGFRYQALAVAGLKKALTTLTPAAILSVKTAMQTYGVDPSKLAWILAPTTNDIVVAQTIGETKQGFGKYVTIANGGITAMFGAQAVTSGKMRENLNASGVYDGTTTDNTVLLLVRTDRHVLGSRRSLTIKTDEKIESDQVQIVGSFRKGYAPLRTPSTTERSVAIGYDLAVTP